MEEASTEDILSGIEPNEWSESEIWKMEIPDIKLEVSEAGVPEISVAENVEIQGSTEEVASTSVIEPSVSFEMPSQQLQTLDSVFNIGGQEFSLNNCGSKRLVIGLVSSRIPSVEIIFKLYDVKNGYYISFGRKTWERILSYEGEIERCMDNNRLTEIFHSNKIRVETQNLYNQCCVIFYDIAETHICMMKPTFQKMMSLKQEIDNVYVELLKKKNDVAKRIKLFIDVSFFHLFKSNNVDHRHNYNWITLFLSDSANTPSFLDLSNSVASTWAQLGKWMANNQENIDFTNEP